MPKFGQVHFGKNYFGDSPYPTENWKRSIANIPLGIRVKRQHRKKVIFRVRRGNGHAGAVAGVAYQDKYKYVVPSSINNPEGEPARANYRAAVDYWKNILTTDERSAYDKKASNIKGLSGYCLFIKEALKGEYHMYVDRGDPSSYDFVKTDFTKDGAWHDLDLSAIVPSTARAILLVGHVEGNAVDWTIKFRKNGQTNEINHGGMETLRANVERCRMIIVAIGSDQIIEYNADNQAWTTFDLAIRGWWT